MSGGFPTPEKPAVGTRIRIVKPVWPERVGCMGTVVAPPADGTYPQPSKREILVLLDDDPIAYDGEWARKPTEWSCVIGWRDVAVYA